MMAIRARMGDHATSTATITIAPPRRRPGIRIVPPGHLDPCPAGGDPHACGLCDHRTPLLARVRAAGAFRFAQTAFGASAWIVVPDAPDDVLAAHGVPLAGPARGVADVTDADLKLILTRSRAPGAEDAAQAVLARCPFGRRSPPLDVDVNPSSSEYDPAASRAEALAHARALDAVLRSRGVVARWHRTNARGGLHADLTFPDGSGHPDLLRAAGRLAKLAAAAAGVPCLSDLPHRRNERPAVYLDDSLFNRDAERRGVLWRLAGGAKPGGDPKTPWDIYADAPSSVGTATSPWPADSIAREIAAIAAERAAVDATPAGRARASLSMDPAAAAAPLTETDRAWLANHPRVARMFRAPPPDARVDRSSRDFAFACEALRAGAEAHVAARLLAALPGGKAATRGDPGRYVSRTVSNALTRIARTQAGVDAPPARVAARVPSRGARRAVRLEPLGASDRAWIEATAIPEAEARGEKVAAKRLRHIASCGHYQVTLSCRGCDGAVRTGVAVCGNHGVCPSCVNSRAFAHERWIRETWPNAPAGGWPDADDNYTNNATMMIIERDPKHPRPAGVSRLDDLRAIRAEVIRHIDRHWNRWQGHTLIGHDYVAIISNGYVIADVDRYRDRPPSREFWSERPWLRGTTRGTRCLRPARMAREVGHVLRDHARVVRLAIAARDVDALLDVEALTRRNVVRKTTSRVMNRPVILDYRALPTNERRAESNARAGHTYGPALPMPTEDQLRDAMKVRAAARRAERGEADADPDCSPCCGAPCSWRTQTPTGRTILETRHPPSFDAILRAASAMGASVTDHATACLTVPIGPP